MTAPLAVSFTAGSSGQWRVERIGKCLGEVLPDAPRLEMTEGVLPQPGRWQLTGFTAELRYTTAPERTGLVAVQAGLGRPGAACAALIPIRKTAAWWNLAQDERRAIFEEKSRHIAIGREYLPAVSRRLHHCRGLGQQFDFLTWFEFAPEATPAFDAMLARLRETEEWRYVEREVDIRLTR